VPNFPALPSLELARLQAEWLSGARSRLLRSAGIHRAKRILDLGCGWGLSTVELAERSGAIVTGIDRLEHAVQFARSQLTSPLSSRVAFQLADATELPLESASIDLIFTQCSLLWMQDLRKVLAECHRLLAPMGRLVAIEPDYGGLMEWPISISTREIWLSALTCAGADPLVGRKLPVLMHEAGFQVNGYFFDRYEAPVSGRLEFLEELVSDAQQRAAIDRIRSELQKLASEDCVVHLPFWLQVATKSKSKHSF
jgi:SAM-dependent methyltransferase